MGRVVARVLAGALAAVALGACTSTAPSPGAGTGTAATGGTAPTATAGAPTAATPGRSGSSTPSVPATVTKPTAAPSRYTRTVLYRGSAKPDDLALDRSGRLLFSDYTNGTVSRLESNGSVTVLFRGLSGPEGIVPLADGTLVVAEENTNRIVALSPGSAPRVLRVMPGSPTLVECHQGTDGIAYDPRSRTLVIPDAPTGTVYRLSLDGRHLSTIARGFVHPVGAAVDGQGNVYVADECGATVTRVTATGRRTVVATVAMPDDVALDGQGNVVVTNVRLAQHDVTRWAPDGSSHTTLARSGLAEPQGLLVEPDGRIIVSDDRADVIVQLTPAA